MVFVVVVIAQLLAFVIALAPLQSSISRWDELARVSLLVQWMALACAAVLCAARPLLRRLPPAPAGAAAYLLLLAVILLVSEVALRVGGHAGLGPGPEYRFEFLWRNLFIGAIVGALALRYFYVQHQWRVSVEARARARLEALQARIRPHFLFNSMNTIASLTRSDPPLAEEAVEDLADLFRTSLSEAQTLVPWREERAVAERYLRMEGLRLGPRLQVAWQVGDLDPEVLLPSLTLQPLVENAVYHGVEPRREGGTVYVSAQRRGAELVVEVRNPLPRQAPARGGHQMALDNLRERLQAHYGAQAALQSGEDGGEWRVCVRLPYREAVPA
ncbi:sensor histidine kinase [Ectothiorhodospiraceae bacterium 2226]|nr:sensor histidine kinase [Ectothiorhodospiraceae bacterium 2226]